MDTIDGAETMRPLGLDPKGLLIYTPDGFMSALLMRTDCSALNLGNANARIVSDGPEKAGDFIGYSGTYILMSTQRPYFTSPAFPLLRV